jgi:hypothetical protein
LRDVERAMKVIIWFYSNSELINWVIGDGDNVRYQDNESVKKYNENESDESVGKGVTSAKVGTSFSRYDVLRLNEIGRARTYEYSFIPS